MLSFYIVRTQVLGLITELSDVPAGSFDVLHAHDLDGLLPLFEIIFVNVKFDPILLKRLLFLIKTLLQPNQLFSDTLFVHLKEPNLFGILVV